MKSPEMGNFGADNEDLEKQIDSTEKTRMEEEKLMDGMSEGDKKEYQKMKARIAKEREDGNITMADNLEADMRSRFMNK